MIIYSPFSSKYNLLDKIIFTAIKVKLVKILSSNCHVQLSHKL
jgi:hypothetical protein